ADRSGPAEIAEFEPANRWRILNAAGLEGGTNGSGNGRPNQPAKGSLDFHESVELPCAGGPTVGDRSCVTRLLQVAHSADVVMFDQSRPRLAAHLHSTRDIIEEGIDGSGEARG